MTVRVGGQLCAAAIVLAVSATGCRSGSSSRDDGIDVDTDPDPSSASEGGESSGDTTGGETGEPSACGDEVRVGSARMRLLTRYEYDNTVLALLGDDSAPGQSFPPENQSTAFENDASDHQVTKDTVRRFMEAAEDLAATAQAQGFAGLLPCDPAAIGGVQCGMEFIDTFGRRAFRRPLLPQERQIFVDLFAEAFNGQDFDNAVSATLQAFLQSPQFLYRIEVIPDDAAPGDIVAVSDYELATRIAYFLTASTPDDVMLDAADAGELASVEAVEAQARRLLGSAGARDSVRHFHRQWLGLGALQSVTKDPADFPGLDTEAAKDEWSTSVQDFVEYVVFDGEGTLSELVSSERVFLTPGLADFYGASPAAGGGHTLPGKRAGILTQPALMALLAYPDRSSPVARGVFVRERILCQALPPPPDDVDITPPDPDPNATTREKFAQHTDDPACAGCHQLIDPLGFTFEHYDAVGRWRTQENDLPIDASGEVISVTDEALAGPVEDAVDMAERLAVSEDFEACSTQQWLTFALGRTPHPDDDECTIQVAQDVVAGTGDIRELLVAIVLSDAFRYRLVEGGG